MSSQKTEFQAWLHEAEKQLEKVSLAASLDLRWMKKFCCNSSSFEPCLRRLIQRRLKGEPIAYLIKEKGFFKYIFETHPKVLIPRPDSEHLLEAAITWATKYIKKNKKTPRFLDIGCGSGCLGISLSKELDLFVHCIDVSKDAITLTLKNKLHLNASKVSTSLLDAQNLCHQNIPFPVEAVLTNPPYIGDQEDICPYVKKFEPHKALFGGGLDGLDLFQSWLPRILSLNAQALFVETSPYQYQKLAQLLKPHFSEIEILKDYSGQQRVITCTL